MADFKVGDVVRRKVGGPCLVVMTVGRGRLHCQWVEADQAERKWLPADGVEHATGADADRALRELEAYRASRTGGS